MEISTYVRNQQHLKILPVSNVSTDYYWVGRDQYPRDTCKLFDREAAEATRCRLCSELTFDCFGITWDVCGPCVAEQWLTDLVNNRLAKRSSILTATLPTYSDRKSLGVTG